MVKSIHMLPYSVEICTVRRRISIIRFDSGDEIYFDVRQIPELINVLREAEGIIKAED